VAVAGRVVGVGVPEVLRDALGLNREVRVLEYFCLDSGIVDAHTLDIGSPKGLFGLEGNAAIGLGLRDAVEDCGSKVGASGTPIEPSGT
jgi:hypothetical protein